MKILITGGCGFIGSNFIHYILNKYPNYYIVNVDLLTYAGNKNNLLGIKNNYKFIQGNILDHNLIDSLMKSADICINFAAESHVDNGIKNPLPFIETNIKGTFNLLEQAKNNKLKRYIQISTDEVYGSLGKTGLFTETSPLAPNSPYSASKAAADLLVRSYIETYKLPAIIVRCSNNYGPRQHTEKFIPLAITSLIKNKKVPIYGDGLNVRDWIYVEDHCKGIDLVMHKGKDGEIYNISSNNEKTNIEVIKILFKHFNKTENSLEYVQDRMGHDRRYALDNSKITKELGFYPEISFELGISKTIDWYKRG